MPKGYWMVHVDVHDPEGYQEYVKANAAAFAKYAAAVPGTLAPFNGQYVVRAGKITPVEGDPPKQRFK